MTTSVHRNTTKRIAVHGSGRLRLRRPRRALFGTIRLFAAVLLAVILVATPQALAQPEIIRLPAAGFDMSDDGTIVSSSGWFWTLSGGVQYPPGFPGGIVNPWDASTGALVSGDGRVFVGRTGSNPPRIVLWTREGGATVIPLPAGVASMTPSAVNRDGSAVVGQLAIDGGGGAYLGRAFVWTPGGGTRVLHGRTNSSTTRAFDVSADGATIVGTDTTTEPVYQYEQYPGGPLLTHFEPISSIGRWSPDFQRLTAPGGDFSGLPLVSADGSRTAGAAGFFGRFVPPEDDDPQTWWQGVGVWGGAYQELHRAGMYLLGYPEISAINGDGSILAGHIADVGDPPPVVWAGRWMALYDYLVESGLNLTGYNPTIINSGSVRAISPDGAHMLLNGHYGGRYLVRNLRPQVDQDNDGIIDIDERDLGTDPRNADTDGDGAPDNWEVPGGGVPYTDANGVERVYPLPEANPLRKNLWIEVDKMAGATFHEQSVDLVKGVFSRAPVDNPDGSRGITLHVQMDEDALEPIDEWQLEVWWPYDYWEYEHSGRPTEWEDSGLMEAKAKAFRYCIIGHRTTPVRIRGVCSGDNMVLFFGDEQRVLQQAIVFLHELGHSLGLGHGGNEDTNFKPNYPSVMNYAVSGFVEFLDYSRRGAEEFEVLDEACLDETAGIGRPDGVYADFYMPVGAWGRDGNNAPVRIIQRVPLDGSPIDFGNTEGTGELDGFKTGVCVTQDVNFVGRPQDEPSPCLSPLETCDEHTPHNDWAAIRLATYASLGPGAPALLGPVEEPTEEQLAWIEQNLAPPRVARLPAEAHSGYNAVPFGAGATTLHQVFDADALRPLMRDGAEALRITRISFASDPAQAGTMHEFLDVQVRLGYTAKAAGEPAPAGLDLPSVGSNPSGPMQVFFESARMEFTGAAANDRHFDLLFEGTPFEYDPELGNLLVEVVATGLANTGGQFLGVSAAAGGPEASLAYESARLGSAASPTSAVRMRLVTESVMPSAEPTAAELLAELVRTVRGLNLQRGISNSLDAKLARAVEALESLQQNNRTVAINLLMAFAHEVSAQSGQAIPPLDALELIATTTRIIELILLEP